MINNMYPCLWFDGQAKEAADYYCSIFKDARITAENPIVVNFELNGNKFMALNGGPQYQFTPATSFVIECENQEDIDYYWNKLGQEGRFDRCGWLTDKFGISWQVVPTVLHQLMADPARSQKVVQAFMKMSKFDIETLTNA